MPVLPELTRDFGLREKITRCVVAVFSDPVRIYDVENLGGGECAIVSGDFINRSFEEPLPDWIALVFVVPTDAEERVRIHRALAEIEVIHEATIYVSFRVPGCEDERYMRPFTSAEVIARNPAERLRGTGVLHFDPQVRTVCKYVCPDAVPAKISAVAGDDIRRPKVSCISGAKLWFDPHLDCERQRVQRSIIGDGQRVIHAIKDKARPAFAHAERPACWKAARDSQSTADDIVRVQFSRKPSRGSERQCKLLRDDERVIFRHRSTHRIRDRHGERCAAGRGCKSSRNATIFRQHERGGQCTSSHSECVRCRATRRRERLPRSLRVCGLFRKVRSKLQRDAEKNYGCSESSRVVSPGPASAENEVHRITCSGCDGVSVRNATAAIRSHEAIENRCGAVADKDIRGRGRRVGIRKICADRVAPANRRSPAHDWHL